MLAPQPVNVTAHVENIKNGGGLLILMKQELANSFSKPCSIQKSRFHNHLPPHPPSQSKIPRKTKAAFIITTYYPTNNIMSSQIAKPSLPKNKTNPSSCSVVLVARHSLRLIAPASVISLPERLRVSFRIWVSGKATSKKTRGSC